MKDLELAHMMLSLARQDHTALKGVENTEVFSIVPKTLSNPQQSPMGKLCPLFAF